MLATTEKTDTELKTDVLAELKYEPSVKVTDIGVQVKDGVVTLIGNVSNYFEKWNAVRATKRVAGVKAIADDIKVHLSEFMNRTDTDIAAAAVDRLDWNLTIPKGTVKITVSDGQTNIESNIISAFKRNAILDAKKIQVQSDGNRVTLRGKVKSYAERDEAERTAWAAPGVYSVDNQIKVEWYWG